MNIEKAEDFLNKVHLAMIKKDSRWMDRYVSEDNYDISTEYKKLEKECTEKVLSLNPSLAEKKEELFEALIKLKAPRVAVIVKNYK